jgi:hypothetical protein
MKSLNRKDREEETQSAQRKAARLSQCLKTVREGGLPAALAALLCVFGG